MSLATARTHLIQITEGRNNLFLFLNMGETPEIPLKPTDNYIRGKCHSSPMQKRERALWIVSLWILMMPVVVAELSLQGPGKSIMNIGDEITVSGYMQRDTNTIATFKLMLSCTTELQLLAKSISLQANVRKEFSEDLVIPTYKDGACVIRAVLEAQSTIIDQASSPVFTISRDLSGTFTLNKDTIKRGDTLTIQGTITKLDNTPMSGIATLKFRQGETEVFIDTASITNGQLSYTFVSSNTPSGTYTIDITPQDVFGNTKTFTAGSFTISGEILIFAEPDKLHYHPGERVKIEGEATILDQPVKKATLLLTLKENKAEDDVSNGKFSKAIQIPYTITSGTQTMTIDIEDPDGNRGSLPLSIIVDPSPTKLDFTQEKESYLPGEIVSIVPVLLDQAGEVIDTEIGIIIATPKGKELFTDTIQSNSGYEFQLAENALPGAWKVKLFAMEMEHEGAILIGEQIKLNYLILNNTLYITNKGNVRFSNPLKVEYKSLEKKFTLVKEFAIDANETVSLNLAKGVEPGIYDVYIDNKVFEDIPITKTGLSTEERVVAVLALIALMIFMALLWYVGGWIHHRRKHPFKKKEIWHDKKVIAAHHPRDDTEHVKLFKQKMASSMESQKQKMRFKVRKSKEGDEYIYELPTKKERVQPQKEPSYPSWDLGRSTEPPGWRESDDQQERKEPSYSFVETSAEQEEKKEDVTEKKKGLFNMFD